MDEGFRGVVCGEDMREDEVCMSIHDCGLVRDAYWQGKLWDNIRRGASKMKI